MSRPEPQPVLEPLSSAALFLVVAAGPSREDARRVLEVSADVGSLVRAVGFRELAGSLKCVVGLGSDLWDRAGPRTRPTGLHPFVPLRGEVHSAPSTPGDVLFHIKAARADLCFELGRLIVDALGDAATVVDDVTGFRYFDARDLLGFVDGTENPVGSGAGAAALVGAEDEEFAGGSYVIVQKYLHDMAAWQSLTVEDQERVIGRTKVENVELADTVKPSNSHVALNTLVDADGTEREILRDNMPFGSLGDAEFGTYFIGYAKDPSVTEEMLRHMFLGDPPGNYDRILDFSTAVTGTLFFAPSLDVLESLGDPETPGAATGDDASLPAGAESDRYGKSLQIGDLKGVAQ
ncbi:Dyp-type peroxidase [Rhodococcus tukisamuensis]|uniref:Putative iron-dependent peroxidase n=1 Tax=Rhodococcus tukisamuensis TaxID=168276 RepID=A0A1G6TE01_9NOCA|nr:Dyp-type peroxidase [Rhodococcus tukisamuensis]SDD27283.1 putative iron-dependent peroxidase [Rhodococcus tukisamuensis]